jgi:hypothetical protein
LITQCRDEVLRLWNEVPSNRGIAGVTILTDKSPIWNYLKDRIREREAIEDVPIPELRNLQSNYQTEFLLLWGILSDQRNIEIGEENSVEPKSRG